jgi:hypothetical protein
MSITRFRMFHRPFHRPFIARPRCGRAVLRTLMTPESTHCGKAAARFAGRISSCLAHLHIHIDGSRCQPTRPSTGQITALNLTQETERATLVRPAATYSIGSFVSVQSNVVLQRENAFTGSKRRCSPAYSPLRVFTPIISRRNCLKA